MQSSDSSIARADPFGVVQAHTRHRLNEVCANTDERITSVSVTLAQGTLATDAAARPLRKSGGQDREIILPLTA